MNNVQKQYIPSETYLAKELAELRKGAGLTPGRLSGKPALRALISRLTNLPVASLTNSQMHAFLVTEAAKIANSRDGKALLNALGLEDGCEASLLGRRAVLAKQLHKHPDTVERYENQGLAVFVAHLSNLQPTQTEPFLAATLSSYVQHLENQASHLRRATTLGLAGLLSLESGADELIGFLESSPQPFINTQIDIAFTSSKRGSKWYCMTLCYTFQSSRDTFRIAAVTKNEDGERLMKRGLIDEFHKLNYTLESMREVRSLINNARFTLRHAKSVQQKLLRPKLLTPEQTKLLLQSVGEPLQGPCHILEVAIPNQWRTADTIYEYFSAIDLRLDDIHYAYWYAPSLMYVKRLTFDYSKFPNADSWQFMAMPFLGHIVGDVLDRNKHSFVLHPNSWIMPGHGIGLTWE
ncbi:MAG TPA: hypothetical protein VFO38_03040 [Candidatus Saccharimonadales bacterium]|nr:hypothetical protein [Candidatus Saccharimonadales bacterium]